MGTNWGWGQTRDQGIFGENFPKFPKNRVGDGEDIFGEYWGPIGDGDRLEIGEFSGKIPQNSPKIGVGTGKTFLGNIGDNLGTGTKFINSPKFPKVPQRLFYKELGTLLLLIKY